MLIFIEIQIETSPEARQIPATAATHLITAIDRIPEIPTTEEIGQVLIKALHQWQDKTKIPTGSIDISETTLYQEGNLEAEDEAVEISEDVLHISLYHTVSNTPNRIEQNWLTPIQMTRAGRLSLRSIKIG